MTQKEIMKEIISNLPAEIVEKIDANTITEEELKQYIQPLAEKYKDQIEGFAPLSDEDLEDVNGGASWTDKLKCLIDTAMTGFIPDIYDACISAREKKN